MNSMMTRVIRSIRDTRAATMAEYAILVAVIAIVVIAGARFLGTSVNNRLNTAGSTITTG